MTLIKSISGIRGTIGGKSGDNLTPADIVKFTAAFATWVQHTQHRNDIRIVIGRDARLSGEMVQQLVMYTLVGMGINVTDAGLSTTPTVEMAVVAEKADAGIIITASHNPIEWNALKLLNAKGEFISAADGEKVLAIAEGNDITYTTVEALGRIKQKDYLPYHIDQILALPLVNKSAIQQAQLHVAVDAVCSSGGIAVPALLKKLGIERIECIHCEPTGRFPHNPEPLAQHLTDLSALVREKKCHLGIAVDPDVDRLVFVCEDGILFGEEYTLVAVADYILQHTPGPTVSNLSSTRALRDISQAYGQAYAAAAVGEVNVVAEMKKIHAVIGGEGNGGVIYPPLHYGRDALVGIALFLSHMATTPHQPLSALRNGYPYYAMSKKKITLEPDTDTDTLLNTIRDKFSHEKINTTDGLKIDFADGWVHLRKSNTEPILRIYTESRTPEKADALAEQWIDEIRRVSMNDE